MPPPLTRPLLLVLLPLLAAPVALAQTTLGELLDAGAARLSEEAFKRDVVQRTIVGTTPAGGTLEIMYAANGSIVGSGTATSGSFARAPVNGVWTIDAQDRICSSMSIGGASGQGGGLPQPTNLPRRCQFWFRFGESFFLSDSDSDRHARVLRRTVGAGPVAAAPLADPTFALPRSMKGSATFANRLHGAVYELSLAISRTNEDGTFEGALTSTGPRCKGKDRPIQNGVARNGEVRFAVWFGIDCSLAVTLRKGTAHLLEGDADDARGAVGVGTAQVWLDPN